eukprot:MONOS_3937.1-p1 / transcript=MONOS_3937.1 / gene=MONOS_3937 / organism=Monocercomonoides_exilis_PA203 / gene_product=hypothetical protein / transcript_product=hypothetical protein / location=Mono_scaffold00098:39022-39849(+) / protein_length=276 / sequence_SO=supercontig / SO=protein_coding / is_pseudo=false
MLSTLRNTKIVERVSSLLASLVVLSVCVSPDYPKECAWSSLKQFCDDSLDEEKGNLPSLKLKSSASECLINNSIGNSSTGLNNSSSSSSSSSPYFIPPTSFFLHTAKHLRSLYSRHGISVRPDEFPFIEIVTDTFDLVSSSIIRRDIGRIEADVVTHTHNAPFDSPFSTISAATSFVDPVSLANSSFPSPSLSSSAASSADGNVDSSSLNSTSSSQTFHSSSSSSSSSSLSSPSLPNQVLRILRLHLRHFRHFLHQIFGTFEFLSYERAYIIICF